MELLSLLLQMNLMFNPSSEEQNPLTEVTTSVSEQWESRNNKHYTPWYDTVAGNVVAHALGQVDGRAETNSKEAFFYSYEQGMRVFEADFQLTSDEVLVVRHDFDQMSYYNLEQMVINQSTDMTVDRFTSELINLKYTPLTAEDLVYLFLEHGDTYLITDSKDTDLDIVQQQFRQLVDIVQKSETAFFLEEELLEGESEEEDEEVSENVEDVPVDEEDFSEPVVEETVEIIPLLDRMVVQIYNQEMFHAVQEVYPFEHWVYTLYQTADPDFHEIGQFCSDNGIDVVTINYTVFTREKWDILNQYGIKVYVHTVNRLFDVYHAQYNGAHGFYSDILTPADVLLLEETFS